MFATEIKTELKRYTEQPLSIWLVPCSLVSSLFSVQPRLPAAFVHYLKAGKESLIFSIHSVSLTERLRAAREEKRGRDGVLESGWGLGQRRNPDGEENQSETQKQKVQR